MSSGNITCTVVRGQVVRGGKEGVWYPLEKWWSFLGRLYSIEFRRNPISLLGTCCLRTCLCFVCGVVEWMRRRSIFSCIVEWWNFNHVTPPSLFIHWACWSGVESRPRVKKGLWLVWHAMIWVLWKARNNRILNDGVEFVDDLVEEIKVLSWRWAMYRLHKQPCMFFEWS